MAKRGFLYNFGKIVVPPIFKLLYFYKIKNKNCLPNTGSYIICSNHLSYKDPLLVALSQRRKIFFMAKQELFRSKFLNRLISSLGAFSVQRGAGAVDALEYAQGLLKKGNVVGIFIEGTRSRDGELLRPKSGAALIAYQTNTPVLPISISAKGGGKLKLFHRITVNCGKPIMPEELGMTTGDRKEFRQATRIIMENITRLRKEDI